MALKFLCEIKEVRAKKQMADNVYMIRLETNDLEALALGALAADELVYITVEPENHG